MSKLDDILHLVEPSINTSVGLNELQQRHNIASQQVKDLILELIGPDNDNPDEGSSEAFIRGRQYERFIMRKEVEKL